MKLSSILSLATFITYETALYAQPPEPDSTAPSNPQNGRSQDSGTSSNGPEGLHLVRQAGLGGPIGYARAGVLELGGSAGFNANSDVTQFTLTPTAGWFIADRLQLSALLNITYVQTDDNLGRSSSSTLASVLAEPSYHIGFTDMVYGFVGLGVGFTYQSQPGVGFALAPRIGSNLLVGRSGIVTPALTWEINAGDRMDAVRVSIGYTIML